MTHEERRALDARIARMIEAKPENPVMVIGQQSPARAWLGSLVYDWIPREFCGSVEASATLRDWLHKNGYRILVESDYYVACVAVESLTTQGRWLVHALRETDSPDFNYCEEALALAVENAGLTKKRAGHDS